MPYITQDRRLAMGSGAVPDNAGELNYEFTMLARCYIQHHGLSYQRINDIIGALDGAKAEFQRRVVAPYEDSKIATNGDVYT